MSRGKKGFFTHVAIWAAVASLAVATAAVAVTPSEPAGASGERALEPAMNLEGFAGAGGVDLTWDLSASDVIYQRPTGTDFTSGGTFTNANDVAGYEVSRNGEILETVPAGETSYTDQLAAGTSLSYEVVAVGAGGNRSEPATALVSLGPPPVSQFTFEGLAAGVIPASVDCAVDVAEGVTITPCSSVLWENLGDDPEAALTVASSVSGAGFVVNASLDNTGAWRLAYTMVIQIGGEETLNIGFDPDAVGNLNGSYTGALTIRTNDPANPRIEVPLTAVVTGGLSGPDIFVSRAAVRFGQIVTTSPTRTIDLIIENRGGLPLTVSTAFSAPSPAYSAVHLADHIIGPSGSVTLGVTIDPSAGIGIHSRDLVITSDDPDQPTITLPMTGTVVTQIVASGGAVRTVVRSEATFTGSVNIPGVVTVDASDSTAVAAFLADTATVALATAAMVDRIAEMAGIDPSRILNGRWVEGSLIFIYDIAEPEEGSTEPSAAAAATTIETAVADTTTTNLLSDVGTVTSTTSEVEETIYPRDPEGTVILGWFTRTEDQVGFNDFFAFADVFGTNSSDPTYDEIFDISPVAAADGNINFDDFFLFADYFGTPVANAAEMRAAFGD